MRPDPYKVYSSLLAVGTGLGMLAILACFQHQSVLNSYLASINFNLFLIMGVDKLAARHETLRAPERIIYAGALLGGSAGVLVGMTAFRHKTQKSKFILAMTSILILQVLLLQYLSPEINGVTI